MLFHKSDAIANLLEKIIQKSEADCGYVFGFDEKSSNLNWEFVQENFKFEDDACHVSLAEYEIVELEKRGFTEIVFYPIKDRKGIEKKGLLLLGWKSRVPGKRENEIGRCGAEMIGSIAGIEGLSSFPDSVGELSDEILETSEKIAMAFDKIRKAPKMGDQWKEGGKERFQLLVASYMAAGLPIPFVMPAFPFKSRNETTKVTGPVPDKGEELALKTLANFAEKIKSYYKPGAEMIVISDGYVFNDIFEISDETVTTYREKLLQMNVNVTFLGFDHFFYQNKHTYQEKRDRLMAVLGETDSVVMDRIKSVPTATAIYCGMKKFMEDEFQSFKAVNGQKRKEKARIKDKVRQMMLRNEAYSSLIQICFPHHVRLSIHPHSNFHKFGVNLIGNSFCGSPWHNVSVYHEASGEWEAMKRVQAESEGYRLTEDDNGLAYYSHSV